MPRAALNLAVLSIAAITRPAECSEAEDLIGRMSATYEAMRPSLEMSARVTKRVQSGEFWKEGTRNYRVWIAGDDIQVRLLGDSNSSLMRTLRAGRVTLYSSLMNQFSDHARDDAGAQGTVKILAQYRVTFFGRFLHLAQAHARVTSSKRATLTIAKEKKDCLRVEIRAPQGSEIKWTGTIWIERETGLVWRARMSALDELKQQVGEEVNWTEIRSGLAASEPVWSVPPKAARIDGWRGSLPY